MTIDLHSISWGMQDDYISKMSSYSFTGEFVETRTIIFKGNQIRKNIVTFTDNNDANRNYGYTNIRFKGDPNQIESIKLELGGCLFDSIHPRIMQKLSTFPIMDQNILPALHTHQFNKGLIIAEHTGDLEIAYDVMHITNPLKENGNCEILYDFTQYYGSEKLSGSMAKVRLVCNHPTTKINVITDKPIFDVIMHIVPGVYYPLTLNSSGPNWTYEYTFDKSINFSKIDCPYIECRLQKDIETTMDIFATSSNVFCIDNYAFGIRFSN